MAKSIPDLLSFLDKVVDPRFVDHSGVLEEAGKTDRGKAFKMQRVLDTYGYDHRLFRFDLPRINLFPYFAKTSGLSKICDYILFVQEADVLHVLLFELKFGTESATQQLHAAEIFADYLLRSASRVGLFSMDSRIQKRKFRVSEERAKQRNRLTKVGPPTPDENDIYNLDHAVKIRIKELLEL
ncbi:MAG: hypothetical protein U0176_00145 [Bacteroidia bacterium]